MTDEIAMGLVFAGIVIWYYFRIRLIAFTEPMRDRLLVLAGKIESHPAARKQDVTFARQLAPRSLSGVYAWGLVVALIIFFSRDAVSRSYRQKLHNEYATLPEDYVDLIAEFTGKFSKSVFSNAPFAWLVFKSLMTLGRIALVLWRGSDVNSMSRVEKRMLVTEEHAFLNKSFSRILQVAA